MSGGSEIVLPWPPSELSPNARCHWRKVHKAKQEYKWSCAATLCPIRPPRVAKGRIPLSITISPPDRRRRDRDNMQASLKYALDCVAEWLGADDYLFDPTYTFGDPVPGGKVVVVVGEP